MLAARVEPKNGAHLNNLQRSPIFAATCARRYIRYLSWPPFTGGNPYRLKISSRRAAVIRPRFSLACPHAASRSPVLTDPPVKFLSGRTSNAPTGAIMRMAARQNCLDGLGPNFFRAILYCLAFCPCLSAGPFSADTTRSSSLSRRWDSRAAQRRPAGSKRFDPRKPCHLASYHPDTRMACRLRGIDLGLLER
jgi:hypothetical protein